MKRADITVGVDYAIGRAASYSERVRATYRGPGSIVVQERASFGGGTRDRTHEGLEFELAEPWPRTAMSSMAFAPHGITLDPTNERRAIVENARLVHGTWQSFEDARDRKKAQREAERRALEERESQAVELEGRLVAHGLTSRDFSVSADPFVRVRLAADAMDALMRRMVERPVVPPGYRVETHELDDGAFEVNVIRAGGDESRVESFTLWRPDDVTWRIEDGGGEKFDPGEARATAAALLTAAEECERRAEVAP